MITVKNVSGTCKAFQVNNTSENVVCTEGQKVSANGATYTVGKKQGKCCIFKIERITIGGTVKDKLIKICEEGQSV